MKDQVCIARGGSLHPLVAAVHVTGEWAMLWQQGRSGGVPGEEPAMLGRLASRPQGQQTGRWR